MPGGLCSQEESGGRQQTGPEVPRGPISPTATFTPGSSAHEPPAVSTGESTCREAYSRVWSRSLRRVEETGGGHLTLDIDTEEDSTDLDSDGEGEGQEEVEVIHFEDIVPDVVLPPPSPDWQQVNEEGMEANEPSVNERLRRRMEVIQEAHEFARGVELVNKANGSSEPSESSGSSGRSLSAGAHEWLSWSPLEEVEEEETARSGEQEVRSSSDESGGGGGAAELVGEPESVRGLAPHKHAWQSTPHQISSQHAERIAQLGENVIYCDKCEMWLNGPAQWEDNKVGKKHKKE